MIAEFVFGGFGVIEYEQVASVRSGKHPFAARDAARDGHRIMMRPLRWLLEKLADHLLGFFVGAIATAVLLPVGASVASKVAGADFFWWIGLLPVAAWFAIAVAAALVIGAAGALILARWGAHNRSGASVAIATAGPSAVWGWAVVDWIDHDGVIWPLEAPRRGAEDRDGVAIRLVEASIPPRCPRCRTELEERPRPLGGYRWSCPAGDFSKHSKDGFAMVADRALKRGRRRFEQQEEARFRQAQEAEERGRAALMDLRAEHGLDAAVGSLEDVMRPGGPHRS